MINELVYGKSSLSRIVSIEPNDSAADVFRELEDGRVVCETVPNSYYILYAEQYSPKMRRLEGDQPFKWMWETDSRSKYKEILAASYEKRFDLHAVRDAKESLMIKDGYTHFKDMKVSDVSVLSTDIETNGLTHDKNSRVLLISNTFRKQGKIVRKLFSLDNYESQSEMLVSWCLWVCEMNPSIIIGHNIFGFDLPYLQHCAQLSKIELQLGRDTSGIKFGHRTSKFRKDGSQSYDYTNALIYGREIVDTYFLAIKSDIARNYESYGLKQIIKQEGLERPGRQHYDASKIKEAWENRKTNPEEWNKVCVYSEDDADDPLKIYDLYIPSLFYYAQSVPRSFQQIVNSATGSQINSLMVRAYLQQGHSIARGSDAVEFDGAISFGIPGVHKNVLRYDVASLYPSVMRQYQIHPKDKDPQGLFLKMVEHFTLERLRNKKLGKDTNDRYYKDLEQSQKIVINSAYGFMGAPKLNYNYPEGAAEVTAHGRRILKQAIKYITSMDFDDSYFESEDDEEEE